MCLSVAVHRPNDVLAVGEHAGHQWQVVHNGRGFRCGYVRVPPGHPWHGASAADLDPAVSVHGGLTFAEGDEPCPLDGPDDGHWVGFDCMHADDAPDPALPGGGDLSGYWHGGVTRCQEYVEAECRRLCEQVAAAA